MNVRLVFVLVLLLGFGTGIALAVPPGKTVEFAGGGAGSVVFDGKIHMEKGLKCNDCHTRIFKMKKGEAQITMSEINAGKFCGACHDGSKAFKSGDTANCARCHRK